MCECKGACVCSREQKGEEKMTQQGETAELEE